MTDVKVDVKAATGLHLLDLPSEFNGRLVETNVEHGHLHNLNASSGPLTESKRRILILASVSRPSSVTKASTFNAVAIAVAAFQALTKDSNLDGIVARQEADDTKVPGARFRSVKFMTNAGSKRDIAPVPTQVSRIGATTSVNVAVRVGSVRLSHFKDEVVITLNIDLEVLPLPHLNIGLNGLTSGQSADADGAILASPVVVANTVVLDTVTMAVAIVVTSSGNDSD